MTLLRPVITPEKIAIYCRYHGNLDGWARMRPRPDPSGMSDADFYRIDELIQKLRLVASGRASASFADKVNLELREAAADHEVHRLLRQLAETPPAAKSG